MVEHLTARALAYLEGRDSLREQPDVAACDGRALNAFDMHVSLRDIWSHGPAHLPTCASCAVLLDAAYSRVPEVTP